MQVDHQCANPSCDCVVEHAGEYCGEACRQQAAREEATPTLCECRHADCGTSTPQTPGAPDQN